MSKIKAWMGALYLVFFFVDMFVGTIHQAIYLKLNTLHGYKYMYHIMPFTEILSHSWVISNLKQIPEYTPFLFRSACLDCFLPMLFLIVLGTCLALYNIRRQPLITISSTRNTKISKVKTLLKEVKV